MVRADALPSRRCCEAWQHCCSSNLALFCCLIWLVSLSAGQQLLRQRRLRRLQRRSLHHDPYDCCCRDDGRHERWLPERSGGRRRGQRDSLREQCSSRHGGTVTHSRWQTNGSTAYGQLGTEKRERLSGSGVAAAIVSRQRLTRQQAPSAGWHRKSGT